MFTRCAWLLSIALTLVSLCAIAQAASSLTDQSSRLRLVPQSNDYQLADIEESADGSRLITHSRQFAPRLWDGKDLRMLAVMGGALDLVTVVHMSRDGKWALTLGAEEIRMWDLARANEISRFPSPQGDFFVDSKFAPDGTRLAVTTGAGKVYIVSTKDGKEIKSLSGLDAYVGSVDWSGDGKTVAAMSGKTIALWNPETDSKVFIKNQEEQLFRTIDLNDAGTTVVVSRMNSGAEAYDAKTGKLKFKMPNVIGVRTEGLRSQVGAAFVLPQDSSILYCEEGGDLVMVDPNTGAEQKRLKGHSAPVDEIRLNQNKTRLGTHGDDEKVIMWDLVSGQQTPFKLKPGDMPTAAAFGAQPDVIWVGMMSGELRKYSLSQGAELASTMGATTTIVRIRFLSPNRLLAVSKNATGSLFIDNLVESKILVLPQRTQDQQAFSFACEQFSDSGRFNLADEAGNIFIQPIKFLAYDLWTGKRVFSANSNDGTSSEFVPNSDVVMMNWADGTAACYDFKLDNEIWSVKFDGAQPGFTGAISPDARLAVHGPYMAGKVYSVWDIDSRKVLHTLERADEFGIRNLKFSADGKIIAGAGREKVAWWEAVSGKLLGSAPHEIAPIDEQEPLRVMFSRDGSHLVMALGNALSSVSLKDPNEVFSVSGASTVIDDADQVFSADASKVLLWRYNTDNKVYVHETATGKTLHRFDLNDTAMQAIFSPDEKRILTVDLVDGIVIWDATTYKRLGNLVQMRDGTWLVMDTEGRYDANDPNDVRGALYVYEWAGGLEPLDVAQFKGYFWDPGLLQKLLGTSKEPKRDVPDLKSLHLYPTVKLVANERGAVDVELEERDEGGIGKVTVSVNGKEILQKAGVGFFRVSADDLRPYLLPENLLTKGHGNMISVQVSNASGTLTSLPTTLDLGVPKGLRAPEVKLYALCVGAGDYVGSSKDLAAPPSDAEDLGKAIKKVSSGFLDNRVLVTEMTTKESDPLLRPTRTNIMRWFDEVGKKATSSDIVMVFFAGHGMDKIGTKSGYFFLTSEADPTALTDANVGNVSISGDDLEAKLRAMPANKQIVILDTCHSGAAAANLVGSERSVSGDYQRAWDSIRQATGTWMLAGAAADQLSYESPNVDHGMLTYALLEAIDKASSDGLRPGQSGELFVDVERWLTYAANRVESLKNEVGLPGIQRPLFKRAASGTSFDIGVLNEKDRGALGLKPPLPVVIIGPFELEQEDPENLEDALRDELSNSTKIKAWTDVAKHPNVYRVAGDYTIDGLQVKVKLYIQRFDGTQKRTTLKTLEITGVRGKPQNLSQALRSAIENEILAFESARSAPDQP